MSLGNQRKLKNAGKLSFLERKADSQEKNNMNKLKRFISEKKTENRNKPLDEAQTKSKNEKALKFINYQNKPHYLHPIYRKPENGRLNNSSKNKDSYVTKCSSNNSLYKQHFSREKEVTKVKNNSTVLSVLAKNIQGGNKCFNKHQENKGNHNTKQIKNDLKESFQDQGCISPAGISNSSSQKNIPEKNQTSIQKQISKKKLLVPSIDVSTKVKIKNDQEAQKSPICLPIDKAKPFFHKFAGNKTKPSSKCHSKELNKSKPKNSSNDLQIDESNLEYSDNYRKFCFKKQKEGVSSESLKKIVQSNKKRFSSKGCLMAEVNNEIKKDKEIFNSDGKGKSLPKFIDMFNKMYQDQETEDRRNLKDNVRECSKEHKIIQTKLEFYQFIKLIGRGSFGKVYLGLQKLTNRLVAIKCLAKQHFIDEVAKSKIKTEVGVLKNLLGHPHVIKLLEVFENEKYVFFVMEYAANSDLLHYLKDMSILGEDEAKVIFYQIASCVRYCHKLGIIHRDIKLDNILIDEHFNCKLCDFGVSRYQKYNEMINEQCGTPAYLAPEIVSEKGYKNFGADIWSLGVLLFSIVTGHMPFKASTKDSLNKNILTGNYDFPEENDLSAELKNLIKKMLTVDPDDRIKIDEIFLHPWLSNIDINLPLVKKIQKFESLQFSYLEEENVTINEFAFEFICSMGFNKDLLREAIKEKKLNHATACYYLIEKDFN